MPIETDPPSTTAPGFAALSPAAARTIDEVCDCFEHQLYTRNALTIEGLIAGFHEPDRSVALRELLLLELERSVSGDARPSLEKYCQRFPQHTAIVQEVFAQLFPAATPTPPAAEPLPVIPNYRILRELSRGGMGAVYEAMHIELGNLVAIKVLRAELVSDLQAEVRFKREMKVIGTLTHSHIVQARDAGKAGATHYLVMEYLVGYDLAQLVERVGPLAVADACEIAHRVALALAHAHQHHLVHRDIKPNNVLFGRTHGGAEAVQVKVADFGLALLRGYPRPHETTSSGVVGTFGYMAPEQYWQQTSDIRSDLYSLGCTLYFLLLSRPPFTRLQYPQVEELMAAHREAAVPSLRKLRPDVSEQLEQLILAMLAKDPRDRPQSPQEVADALAPHSRGHDFDRLLTEAKGETELEAGHTSPAASGSLTSHTEPWTSAAVAVETIVAPAKRFPSEPTFRPPGRSFSPALWLLLLAMVMLPIIGYLAWPRTQAKPIDLLAEIDVKRDAITGDWQVQRKALVSPDEPYARLALPHAAPAAYKLEVTARRISGGRLVLGLVRDGRQLPIVINTTTVGGGRDAEEASHRDLAVQVGFTGGPASTYTAIVHPQGTLVAFEDRVLQAYGPGDTPGGAAAWRTEDNILFVGTHNSVYHFTHIALTPLHR
jgi:serine/threonine protein kinase